MPSPKQERQTAIETLIRYFESKGHLPRLIDPILFKARSLYPLLKESTIREYAGTVLKIFDSKWNEAPINGEVQSNP